MKKLTIHCSCFLLLLNFSCKVDDLPQDYMGSCDRPAIISKEGYNRSSTSNYWINKATITGNCLVVEISASGCDGTTWDVELYDHGSIAESDPEQRKLKIYLENKEICLAVPTKEFSFDLTPLRTSNNEVLLQLEGWEEFLLYRY